MPITWKLFFEYLFESVNSGKIRVTRKCLFSGSTLNDERSEVSKIRVGRLRFLLRSIENGSSTADEILQKILTVIEYSGPHDLPEDDPDWWMSMAKTIYFEAAQKK